MVILRSQNKITDLFFILALLGPFKIIYRPSNFIINDHVDAKKRLVGVNGALTSCWVRDGHHHRQWTNVKPTLGQCFAFSEMYT